MDYVILLLGFLLLIKGADYFVDGASSIAKYFKMPPILIGLTIVAFGTSAPEASVSIGAAIKGSNDIVIGNILGSNIFNMLLVLGVCSVINPIKVKRGTVLKEFPFALLSSIVLYILSKDIILQPQRSNVLSRGDGLILLSLFSIFVYYLVEMALMSEERVSDNTKFVPLHKSALWIAVGLGGIILGGNWVITSSSSIGMRLGMSEGLVGLTIVAVGTSLPELVTSIVAALKGQSDLAVGNIIGSNLFNVLFILGASAVISPVTIHSSLFFDIVYMLLATLMAFVFSATKWTASKKEGIMLALSYIAYMVYIVVRN